MASAYHWEARRRQMALDQRKYLMNQQKQQQEQESQSMPAQAQPPPQLPAPSKPPQQRPPPNAHGPLPQGTFKHVLQLSQRPAPQLSSEETQPTGKQHKCFNNRAQEKRTPADPGFRKAPQRSPEQHTKYSRLTSTNYIQQW